LANEFLGWDWGILNKNLVKEGHPLLPRAEGWPLILIYLGKKTREGTKVERKASVHGGFSSTHIALGVQYKPLTSP
jgi:hypothetical protein